jgi:hypothetical protein
MARTYRHLKILSASFSVVSDPAGNDEAFDHSVWGSSVVGLVTCWTMADW